MQGLLGQALTVAVEIGDRQRRRLAVSAEGEDLGAGAVGVSAGGSLPNTERPKCLSGWRSCLGPSRSTIPSAPLPAAAISIAPQRSAGSAN